LYLQATDPAIGMTVSNTKLILVTRDLKRTEIHNEIHWLFSGPWSPDGTAAVWGDRDEQSFVIRPDSLTKLPLPTQWAWLDAGTVAGVAQSKDGAQIVRADARTGQIQRRTTIPNMPNAIGTVSPNGDWVGFSTAVPDAPGEAVTASATARVSSGPRTTPAGWLPDGRFVFVRQSAASTVEVRDPARSDATVLGKFGDLIDALAQPATPVVVVHDVRTNAMWAIHGTDVRAVPQLSLPQGQVMLESISRDGRTVSFSLPGAFGPAQRTGTIDLETGAVTYMCDAGCWRLVLN